MLYWPVFSYLGLIDYPLVLLHCMLKRAWSWLIITWVLNAALHAQISTCKNVVPANFLCV